MENRRASGAPLRVLLLFGLGLLALWGAGQHGPARPGGRGGEETGPSRADETPAPDGPTQSDGESGRATPAATPRSAGEALVAAAVARQTGDRRSEEAMLVAALAGSDLGQVARVELAELLVETEPRRAVSGLLPVLTRPESPELLTAAVDLAVRALTSDPLAVDEPELRRIGATMPRLEARRLELVAASDDSVHRRQRLDRLLEESSDDLVALAAAEGLAGVADLAAAERWNAGRAFFRHGRYDDALQVLGGLPERGAVGVSAWELAFTRGRACFRLGRFEDAASWYRVAAAVAETAECRAMLEVHRSRALELAGELDEAVDAARRAVGARSTDERHLHLLRLRLRQGREDLAVDGQRRLQGRRARAEGAMRLALYDLAAGRAESAGRRLAVIGSRPWGGPAAVLRARLAVDQQQWDAAVAALDGSVELLDPFWSMAAREVMEALPSTERASWRQSCSQALGSGLGAQRRRALRRWAVLECEPEALAELRQQVASSGGFEIPGEHLPTFTSSLAGQLWALGLRAAAARFDPGAFPRRTPGEALWSARTLLAFAGFHHAIRLADSAARQALPGMPARVLPTAVREALHPLPRPALVIQAVAGTGVEPPLLAAMVREESRWQPNALSAVGARGLTQLMPATAEALAGRMGLAPPAPESLFEPALALRLGAAELGRLLAEFGGQRAVAVAAYNAGETQARVWLEECGQSCNDERLVAGITFEATRGYVADVLASAGEYRDLYPDLTPAAGEGQPVDTDRTP